MILDYNVIDNDRPDAFISALSGTVNSGDDRPDAFISALSGTVNSGYKRNKSCQLQVSAFHNEFLCSDLRDIRTISQQLPKGVMLINGSNCLEVSEKIFKYCLGKNHPLIEAWFQWIYHVLLPPWWLELCFCILVTILLSCVRFFHFHSATPVVMTVSELSEEVAVTVSELPDYSNMYRQSRYVTAELPDESIDQNFSCAMPRVAPVCNCQCPPVLYSGDMYHSLVGTPVVHVPLPVRDTCCPYTTQTFPQTVSELPDYSNMYRQSRYVTAKFLYESIDQNFPWAMPRVAPVCNCQCPAVLYSSGRDISQYCDTAFLS